MKYVSPNGTGDGLTKEAPMNWQAINGGEYEFLAGSYIGQITLRAEQCPPGTRTVLRSETRYNAVIYGSEFAGLYIKEDCGEVVVDGFDVGFNSLFGLRTDALNTIFKNCRVHHNGMSGIYTLNANPWIDACLVEYNGSHLLWDHGMYLDRSDGAKVTRCIVRMNASCGITCEINSIVENNLVLDNKYWGILVKSEDDNHNSIVEHNTVCGNGNGIRADAMIRDNISVQNIVEQISIRNFGIQDNNFTLGNAQFIDPERGWYYLNNGSPCIGKGTPETGPGDFFGDTSVPTDLGCYRYRDIDVSKLPDYAYFSSFEGTLNFRRPDLWKIPE